MLGALEERRRGDPVVVIGVHSAKFEAEGEAARIADAMARHGIRHPVVVDTGHRVWQSYGVRSWPTLVVLRPDLTVAAVAPGEAELEPLDAFVGKILDEARADGTLARRRYDFGAAPPAPGGALSFPGKVIRLADGGLVVSDSGHHRVLVLEEDGRLRDVFGDGAAGRADGGAAEARFSNPQGLAVDGRLLFVADTANHAVREVDLDRRIVRTIAGTGSLGRGVPRRAAPAREVALRSPWDLAVAGDYLLVAMAGTHQLWAYHRRQETIGIFAGSGREAIDDGPLPSATFAQPSGLALVDGRLYLADSETSAVRYVDLVEGQVRTLVGTGLFDFGDRDGPRERALLQHPVGLAHGPSGLLVADTYNDKVKAVDTETGAVRTWFASASGLTLREPTGLCVLPDGRAIVADTGHHRLVVIAADAASARVLEVQGVEEPGPPPAAPGRGVVAEAASPRQAPLEAADLAPGRVTLVVTFEPPPGFGVAEGSPASARLTLPSGRTRESRLRVEGSEIEAAFELGADDLPGETPMVEVAVDAVVCDEGEAAACHPVSAAYVWPLRRRPGAPARAEAVAVLPAP